MLAPLTTRPQPRVSMEFPREICWDIVAEQLPSPRRPQTNPGSGVLWRPREGFRLVHGLEIKTPRRLQRLGSVTFQAHGALSWLCSFKIPTNAWLHFRRPQSGTRTCVGTQSQPVVWARRDPASVAQCAKPGDKPPSASLLWASLALREAQDVIAGGQNSGCNWSSEHCEDERGVGAGGWVSGPKTSPSCSDSRLPHTPFNPTP